MNDEQWIETMEGQALAASDYFDIGASADPDAILAANAKHHVLWLVEKLRAARNEVAEWRGVADMLAGHHAAHAGHDAPDSDCPFVRAAYRHYLRAGGTVRPPRTTGPSVDVADLLAGAREEHRDRR